jgi:hypothetical protein
MMLKVEYKVVEKNSGIDPKDFNEGNMNSLWERRLNEIGAEGWELAGIDGWLYIFQRKVVKK